MSNLLLMASIVAAALVAPSSGGVHAPAAVPVPVDPGARVVEFPLPSPGALPNDILAAADGGVWVSSYSDKQIVRLDRSGKVVGSSALTGWPTSLATDNEGGAWVAERASNAIAHVRADGSVKEYRVPTANSFPAYVYDSGDLVFFTESSTAKLGRLTESTNVIDEFDIPEAETPWTIDGFGDQVWVTDSTAKVLWRMDVNGVRYDSFYAGFDSELRAIDITGDDTGYFSSEQSLSRFDGTSPRPTGYLNDRGDIQGFVARDHDLWLVDASTNSFVHTGVPGSQRDFSVPTANSGLTGLVMTEGRYLWSVEKKAGKVVRLDSLVTTAVDRIGGADRYEMSANVSREIFRFPSTVFIASGEKFADALSAAPIASASLAPVLLTSRDTLPAPVASELRRQEIYNVVVVGGTASVSDAVVESVREAAPKATITRIGGSDRYEVSRALLASKWGPSKRDTLYIATGAGFSDALSSGAAAGRYRSGILLVDGTAQQLTDDQLAVARQYSGNGKTIKIAGGPLTISVAIEAQLSSIAHTVRFGGADRYEVSMAINDDAFPEADTMLFASGASFPDALAGGAAANHWYTGGPLYLVHPDCVPERLFNRILGSHYYAVRLLGGPNSLSPQVEALTPCP